MVGDHDQQHVVRLRAGGLKSQVQRPALGKVHWCRPETTYRQLQPEERMTLASLCEARSGVRTPARARMFPLDYQL
jgi:hypothetical protein